MGIAAEVAGGSGVAGRAGCDRASGCGSASSGVVHSGREGRAGKGELDKEGSGVRCLAGGRSGAGEDLDRPCPSYVEKGEDGVEASDCASV